MSWSLRKVLHHFDLQKGNIQPRERKIKLQVPRYRKADQSRAAFWEFQVTCKKECHKTFLLSYPASSTYWNQNRSTLPPRPYQSAHCQVLCPYEQCPSYDSRPRLSKSTWKSSLPFVMEFFFMGMSFLVFEVRDL